MNEYGTIIHNLIITPIVWAPALIATIVGLAILTKIGK